MRRVTRRRPIPKSALLLLLPMMFLLTAPLPLPRGIAQSVPLQKPALPTARIALSTRVAVALSPPPSATIVPSSTVAPSDTPLPSVTIAPSETPAPSTTPAPSVLPSPTAIPSPIYVQAAASATLPAHLELVPTLLPTNPAPPLPPVAPSAVAALAPPGVPIAIPTLMYHYVRFVDQASDPLGFNLSVTPEHLEQHLALLAERGYTTVRMNTLSHCVSGDATQSCPAHAIALTFDDGYEDAFTDALPALQRHGMVATFYIISGFVGQPGYMNWDQIRVLRDAGMEIGSHTVNHLDLTSLSLDAARAELVNSRSQIEAQVHVPVVSFCYPSGRFNATVAALVREAGYTNATTTMPDLPQSDLAALPRLRVDGSYGLAEFQWLVP